MISVLLLVAVERSKPLTAESDATSVSSRSSYFVTVKFDQNSQLNYYLCH